MCSSDLAKLAAAKAAQKANPPPGKVEAPAVVSRQEAPQVASKPKEPEAVQPAPAAVSPYAQCGSITNPLASLSVLSAPPVGSGPPGSAGPPGWWG